MGPDFSRYRELMTGLARQCLDRSAAAPALAQARGWPVSVGAPAARVLLGDPVTPGDLAAASKTLSEAGRSPAPVRFNDTFGFSRPVYHPLLVHLHLRADSPPPGRGWGRVPPDSLCPPQEDRSSVGDVAVTLWWALCRYERGHPGDADAARRLIQPIVDRPGPEGALHARRGDDQLDAWTYRELTGLHALARLALLDGNAPWWQRVEQIARHHQAVTQPDYTTYQPWAVFAFLAFPDTRLFGEQQLHDAETNLHVETAGAGLLAGLLLADAADAMNGEKIP